MERKRIGVMIDSFREGFARGVAEAAKLQVGGVQITAVDELSPKALLGAQARADVRARLQDNALALFAVCGELGGHGLANRAENAWKVPELQRILDLTAELHGTVMTTHIGVIPAADNDQRATMRTAMSALCAHAEKVGVRIAIETGPEPIAVLRAFLGELPGASAGANYDPANIAMVLGDDPVAGVPLLAGRIYHTHAKDGRMLRYLGPEKIYAFFAEGGIGDLRMGDYFLETPLGEGSVNLPAWIQALRGIGYDGFYTIEREVGESPASDIAQAVRFLEAL